MVCKLSLVIPCRDEKDQKLQELLRSIESQDFNKDEMETLVITEGTSESAKAIGIRKAKGEVIGILASDNELTTPIFLRAMYHFASESGCAYPQQYYPIDSDCLNRYFALIGGNDPLSYYMGKNDKASYIEGFKMMNKNLAHGDNGFFIKKELIESTDLDNYYHIDNAFEADCTPRPISLTILHKTGGNIFSFYAKRYRYGLQHAFNKNRRWHLVDFRKPKDIWRLLWFVLATLTLIEPLSISFRGWMKIKDVAWFIHPLACFLTLVTYTLLMIHLGLRGLIQSSYALMGGQTA